MKCPKCGYGMKSEPDADDKKMKKPARKKKAKKAGKKMGY